METKDLGWLAGDGDRRVWVFGFGSWPGFFNEREREREREREIIHFVLFRFLVFIFFNSWCS